MFYTILIIGAVHISQTLAPLAQSLGYAVRVIDPRPAFADPARFAGIDLEAEWPEDCLSQADFDTATDLCLLSHDPKIDDPAILMAMKSPKGHGYVGALGSRKTGAKRHQRLLQAGLSDAQISSIYAPIGLDIGSKTPAEIGVAIAAQLIEYHRKIVA